MMPRFRTERWLDDYGFVRQEGDWWAFEGLPYLTLDVHRDQQSCVIREWREVFPPRTAIGEHKEDAWDHDEPPVRWTEYRFPWPQTFAQAEAMADAMGWREDAPEPNDTPLDEWITGVETLLSGPDA
jgi:hypothetical protein